MYSSPGACTQCQTRDDPTNPIRILFDNDPTITRSDTNTEVVPPAEIARRRANYSQLVANTQARHRALSLRFDPHGLLYNDFSTEHFDTTAREFLFYHILLQSHTGTVDPALFYAELRQRRAEEDRLGIAPEQRQYYHGDRFDETDLMSLIKSTDERLVGKKCMICQEDFLPQPHDTRMLPCGDIFHWSCISEWYYLTDPSCPYCRRRFQMTELPRFLPPP